MQNRHLVEKSALAGAGDKPWWGNTFSHGFHSVLHGSKVSQI